MTPPPEIVALKFAWLNPEAAAESDVVIVGALVYPVPLLVVQIWPYVLRQAHSVFQLIFYSLLFFEYFLNLESCFFVN